MPSSAVQDSDKVFAGSIPGLYDRYLVPLLFAPFAEDLTERLRGFAGEHVLELAAGTGIVTGRLAQVLPKAKIVATDLNQAMLDVAATKVPPESVTFQAVDAQDLPFEDASFDAVISSIGVMFAPHHQAAADELVRVCRPGGTIGLLSWTPEGMIGGLFRTIGPFAPPPPPGASPAPLWGSEDHLRDLFGDRVDFRLLERQIIEVTAFADPRAHAEHFRTQYGPTIVARANAERSGREADFDAALDGFSEEWNRGSDGAARYEKEYLLAVGTRR
jgi:SAM-dependent methyltransferase